MNIYTENQNDIIHETSVDFVLRPCTKEIHIVQYDKSLPVVKVELFKNGERYVLPENATVNIRVGKLDHTFVYESILGTNEERTIVYFEISEQMATIPGKIWPVLEVIENSKVACSSPLCFIIEQNPIQEGQIESHDDFPIIYELQGTVADHEARITALESQVGGEVVTLHTNQYNIDGEKTFLNNVYFSNPAKLWLYFTATDPNHAVNKGYVDAAIENVEIRSDVIDVVGTYQDLQNYDTSDVHLNDLIKVISDSTHNNAISYYRWEDVSGTQQWVYVASEGPFYTISQVDSITDSLDERKLELHTFNGFKEGAQIEDQIGNGEKIYCESGQQTDFDPTDNPLIEFVWTVSGTKRPVYFKSIYIKYVRDSDQQIVEFNKIFTESPIPNNASANGATFTVDGITFMLEVTPFSASDDVKVSSFDNTKGVHIGTTSLAANVVKLQTTTLRNCTIKEVKIETSGAGTASGSSRTLYLNVGNDRWNSNGSTTINFTTTNTQYLFNNGENGTHIGSGEGEIRTYSKVFIAKSSTGVISTETPNSDYLYISSNELRLYKYINQTMSEVSKTRLGTTSDTAYRGDYGQDNYNQIQAIKNNDTTFYGHKTFLNNSGITITPDGDSSTSLISNSSGLDITFGGLGDTGRVFIDGNLHLNGSLFNGPYSITVDQIVAKYDKPSGGIPASDLAESYSLSTHNHDSSYVAKNTAITGATKCKITYDSKGLVTAGADLAANDIPDLSAVYVALTGNQSISGNKTFSGNIIANEEITSNGPIILKNGASAINFYKSTSSSSTGAYIRGTGDGDNIWLYTSNLYLKSGATIHDGSGSSAPSITIAQIIAKYDKPSGGIPDTDIASASTWNAKYSKPSGGIPDTDIASASTWNAKTKINLNGSDKTTATIYAPTTSGTAGQVLQSNGEGQAPTWVAAPASGVSSVKGGTGLSPTTATSGDVTISIASGYKLLTTSEYTTLNGKYTKPTNGIPASDLESYVLQSLSSMTWGTGSIGYIYTSEGMFSVTRNLGVDYGYSLRFGADNSGTKGGVHATGIAIGGTALIGTPGTGYVKFTASNENSVTLYAGISFYNYILTCDSRTDDTNYRYFKLPEKSAGTYTLLTTSEKGVANGIASLDSNGIVPTSQLPAATVAPTSLMTPAFVGYATSGDLSIPAMRIGSSSGKQMSAGTYRGVKIYVGNIGADSNGIYVLTYGGIMLMFVCYGMTANILYYNYGPSMHTASGIVYTSCAYYYYIDSSGYLTIFTTTSAPANGYVCYLHKLRLY